MHKTVYIDVDEEIIGIIRKIRTAESEEIFLVIPKNSLLTQGIVNLKLLKKEVAKMGKEIILVTSDEHSKRIIEKIGLKTKTKSVQDFVREEDDQADLSQRKISSDKLSFETTPQRNKKRKIGSTSFYGSDKKEEEKVVFSEENSKFDSGDSLNFSQQENPFISSSETKKIRVKEDNSFGQEHIENQEGREKVEDFNLNNNKNFDQELKPNKREEFKITNQVQDINSENHDKTIDDFYQSHLKSTSEENSFKENKKDKKAFQISNKKKFAFFLTFLTFVFLGGLGFWAYYNWPKMEVELFSKEIVKETTLNLVICDEKTAGKECLKGDYQELRIEISQNYDSSGEKFSNDKGMARGIVKIYNNYSSNPQNLVATTRILSKEGKLFRLIKGATVPGMKDGEPGVVEAQVIADKIGQDYNLEPTEFTIEGFKGGDKYDKFKVISESSMTGGANDTDNKKVKVVTENDISSAREKTIDLFNQKLEENIRKQIDSSETFVINSIEKEIVKSDSSYAPGDIIDKFNYAIEQKIKLITFNEKDFNDIIKKSFDQEATEDLIFNEIGKIDFQKDVANYQRKELDLVIKAEAVYCPIIGKEEIKNQLATKNEEEMKDYLKNLDQISKAIISYHPSWLSFMPTRKDNIILKEITKI